MIVDDPVVLEQLPDRLAGLVAEDRQRRVLGGGDRDRQLDVHVLSARGCHQRELVDRQRPSDPSGDDERQTVHVAALDVLDQPVQQLIQPRVVDRERMLEARVQASAEGEQERVIGELLARLGVHDAPLTLQPLEAVDAQLDADVSRDLVERIPRGPRRSRTARARSSAGTRTPGRARSSSSRSARRPARATPAPPRAPATPPPTISTLNGSAEEFTKVTATPGRGEPVGGASRPPG